MDVADGARGLTTSFAIERSEERRGGPPHRGEVRVVGRAAVNTIETVEGNGEKGLGLRLTLDLDELLYRQLLAVDWVYPRQGERTE
jgi:hypothetical protein